MAQSPLHTSGWRREAIIPSRQVFRENPSPLLPALLRSVQEPACGHPLTVTRDALPLLEAFPPCLGVCQKSYMWKGTGFHQAIGDLCLSEKQSRGAGSGGGGKKGSEAPQRSHYCRMWFEFHSSLPTTPSAPFIKGIKLKTQDVIATWAQSPEIVGARQTDNTDHKPKGESRVGSHV